MGEVKTVKVDKLKLLYMDVRDKLVREGELLANNITNIFWDNLYKKVKYKELINIAVIGEVATGKSTVGMEIMRRVNGYVTEGDKKREIDHYSMIFSDQTEFIRFIHKDVRNVCVLIDEFNRMAETGLNATTETHLFDFYSDVFAQKNVHRVNCAPSTIADNNTTIILEVIGTNRDEKNTKCKLKYREVTEGQPVMLGIVDIDVSKVLEEDYYRRYRLKKFKRMELLDSHGVRDIRELEFSGLVLQTFSELRDIAEIQKVSHELVLSTVTSVVRNNKRIYSILTHNEIATRVKSILGLYTELRKLEKKLGENTDEKLRRAKDTIHKQLKGRIAEENKLQAVYEKYMNIK